MFDIKELIGFIIVILLLFYSHRILQFLTLLYFKFKFYEPKIISRQELDISVLQTIAVYEKILLSKGFVKKYIIELDGVIVGRDLTNYKFYYYQPNEGVHAMVETQPHIGSLHSAKIVFDTVYESMHVCTTENGAKHFMPTIPKEVYIFDHYLSTSEKVYERHLKDREMDNETILKTPFETGAFINYEKYKQELYIDEYVQKGIAKYTEYGYRFVASLKLWKISKNMIQGQRRVKQMLKESVTPSEESNKSQIQGILNQLDDMDKSKGDTNKMIWFIGSLVAFVLLFSLFGFSLVNIVILIIILFIHELGHLLAMRYFGYRDTNILFLPFGAVTIGKKERRSAFEEFVVSLVGPLPGIIIGILILIGVTQYNIEILNSSFLNTYAIMSLIINYINLLPIYPLDGGRILQTLLLLRYPRGQFYFYVISLGLLIVAMVYFRDYILLILVAILFLGLKQSYHISGLLKHLLQNNSEKEIDKESVTKIIVEDAKYAKVSLTNKANLAKQVLIITQTGKPSKKLVWFGFGLYVALLAPALILTYIGFYTLLHSNYTKLSSKTKEELKVYNQKINSYRGVTKAPDTTDYTIKESMQQIDKYLSISNIERVVGEPLKIDTNNTKLPCDIPFELKKIYKWHNGIEVLLPYENLYTYANLIKNYIEIKEEKLKYDDGNDLNLIPIVADYESYGLAYDCNADGLYSYSRYSYDSSMQKEYYDFNHFLKITAEAYRTKAYYDNYGAVDVDMKKIVKITHTYRSDIDKQRYEEFLEYLKRKAIEYKDKPNTYMKTSIIEEISNTYNPKMVEFITIYLNDKNEKIVLNAIYTLGSIGNKNTLTILIDYLKSDKEKYRNFALLAISEIVNVNNVEILDKIYPLLKDRSILVRLSAYEVIKKIGSLSSIPYLKAVFYNESPTCKLSISEIFGYTKSKEALPLLEQYLTQINKMDLTQENKGGFRGSDPHPQILKDEVEKAIKSIKTSMISY